MDVGAFRGRVRDLVLPPRWDLMGFALSRTHATGLLAFASSALWAAEASLGLQVLLYLCAAVSAMFIVMGAVDVVDGSSARLVWGVAGAGVLGAFAVGVGTEGGMLVPLVGGCVLSGASMGYFESIWGSRFTTLSHERIQSYTLLMTAVAALMGAGLGFVGGPLFYIAVAALPLGAAALYLHGANAVRDGGDVSAGVAPKRVEADEGEGLRRHRALINIMACCLMFSCIYNMVVVLAYDYLPAGGASQVRFVANLVTALGLLVLSVFLRPVGSITLFKLVLPVTAVGFVLYLMSPEALGWASLAVSGIGRKLFDILTWVLVAQAVRAHQLGPNRYFGFLIAGKNLGYLLGMLLATVTLTYDPGVVQMVTVVPVLLLALIVLFSWLFPERTIDQLFGAVERAVPPETLLDQKAAYVARACGCTPREAEVLLLLARGRTQSVIASKLGISTGTAHTHIVHVYQKLGVGKQQELIERIESAEVEA